MYKEVNKHTHKIRIERNRFGVCKKEYWFFDWIDFYIEMLILLNCELIDQYKTCRYLLGWILEILQEKWDTIRFIEFEVALSLADELKFFVLKDTITDHYRSNKKTACKICKKAKISDDLNLILENDFFKDGDDKYIAIRSLIFNKIRTGYDFYNVDNIVSDDLSNLF